MKKEKKRKKIEYFSREKGTGEIIFSIIEIFLLYITCGYRIYYLHFWSCNHVANC